MVLLLLLLLVTVAMAMVLGVINSVLGVESDDVINGVVDVMTTSVHGGAQPLSGLHSLLICY